MDFFIYKKKLLFTPLFINLLFNANYRLNITGECGLKDHTGRPRPREIKQFGETGNICLHFKLEFQVAVILSCGHCSIAFPLTSGIVFWRLSRKLATLSLSLGLFMEYLELCTYSSGGHFITMLGHLVLLAHFNSSLLFRLFEREKKL